jgi:Regulator of chromosome condensation (RCC1) repeat
MMLRLTLVALACWAGASGAGSQAPITPSTAAGAVWNHAEIVASDHMCALRSDGRVLCWGQNNYGEVGDRAGTAHAVPILVPGVRGAVSLAAGISGTCAVLGSGRVWCWGSYKEARAKPALVEGIDGAVEVAIAGEHRCARRRDGAVWCWTAGDATPPAPIPGLASARRLVAGFAYVCAIAAEARVKCALFREPPANQPSPPPALMEVPEAKGAVQLAAHFRTTCGVLGDGTVRCWMLQDDLGRPSLQISRVAGIVDAIDVAAGLSEVCAARRSGDAVCFYSGARPGVPTPLRPARALRKFRAVALASSTHCGVRPDGQVVCWGEDWGPSGRYSSREALPKPTPIARIGDAVGIAVEYARSCARRRDGNVACWQDAGDAKTIPGVRAEGLFAGREFTCATAAGSAMCWGRQSWTDCRMVDPDNCQFEHLEPPRRFDGLLGIRGAVALADPCVMAAGGRVVCRAGEFRGIRTVEIPAITGARAVSGRCAVEGDGRVSCWGPLVVDGAVKVPRTASRIRLSPAIDVASGKEHSCAATAAGRVFCWGSNQDGQLGDGTRIFRSEAVEVVGLRDVVQVAAGDLFACARTRPGRVLCWGSNRDGALGDGSGRDQVRPVAAQGIDDAVEIRAAGMRVCARRAGGGVSCWGHVYRDRFTETTPETAVPIAAPDVID